MKLTSIIVGLLYSVLNSVHHNIVSFIFFSFFCFQYGKAGANSIKFIFKFVPTLSFFLLSSIVIALPFLF